ncbi:MAG: DUF3179 domain-containing protein [Chloroflexi bacterium]|nr:DUF3179 domain-containing protein [Chloroflexota bacterium]
MRARHAAVALVAVGALVAVACGSGGVAPDATPTTDPGRGVLAGTDTDRHNVALADIHFDTFIGGTIPLSEIDEATILALRDRIPPLDNPLYDPVEGGDWLSPDDLVLGYEATDGQAYAYPVKILNFHEIVNDELGGQAVLISYCPLCRSGIVYDRGLDGRVLSFANTSALFQSDLVMYDRETLSYWFQVGGEAIVGELAGARLEPLPSFTTTWSAWRDLHPDTLVLSRETGFVRSYDRDVGAGLEDSINRGNYPFPVTDAALDGRLPPAALVLGVELGDEARAYPIETLGDAVVTDTFGDESVVVFNRADGPAAAAFRPEANGRSLTFELRGGRFVDRETESEWSLSGEAVAGPLAGQRLDQLPVRTTFWFAYVAAFPEVTVYGQ